MTRIRWIILTLCLTAPLPAQEVALVGAVRDSTTGAPIVDAVISLPEQSLSVRSRPDGFFRLEGLTSGTHTVFVRKAGYEPWAFRMTVNLTDERDVSVGVVALASAHEATFFGIVVDSATGLPLSGATVALTEQMGTVTTNDSGYFEIPGVRAGTHEVTARMIGYRTWGRDVALSIPQPMRVDFGRIPLAATGAVTLDDITVEAEAFESSAIMEDFLHRRRTEQGTFLTYEDITRLNPKNTSDLFRQIPGMNAHRSGVVSSGRGSGGLQGFDPCTMQYYVDGVKVTASTIDVILPNVIAGIEVYRGAATTPQIFRSQSNANCGVIVIWTRDGRPNRRL